MPVYSTETHSNVHQKNPPCTRIFIASLFKQLKYEAPKFLTEIANCMILMESLHSTYDNAGQFHKHNVKISQTKIYKILYKFLKQK